MTLINNNMSFNGSYKLVIPENQKENIKTYMKKSLSDEEIAKFKADLNEARTYVLKTLPADDSVELMLGNTKPTLLDKLIAFPIAWIPGALDWMDVQIKYVPGSRSKKLGMKELNKQASEQTFKFTFDNNIVEPFEKFKQEKKVLGQKKLIPDDDPVKSPKEQFIDELLKQ